MTREEHEVWVARGLAFEWQMPAAPLWKRMWGVRHIRVLYLAWRISQHERLWRSVGAIPSGYDNWILVGIWHGMERPA